MGKRTRPHREPTEPRYRHALELIDWAACLRRAILQADGALREADLDDADRTLAEGALQASRDKLARIVAALRHGDGDSVAVLEDPAGNSETEGSERELLEATRRLDEDPDAGARDTARAIERLGRSLKVAARDAIEPFLLHPSPILRSAAMKVLALHWRLREYTDRVLWSLATDEEADCRRAAALCLGSLYEGTRDLAIGSELASVILKEDEEEDVRWACWVALQDLDGKGARPAPLPDAGFPPARDLDAGVIHRYARAARAR